MSDLTMRGTLHVAGHEFDEAEGIARAVIDETLQAFAAYVNTTVTDNEDRFVLFGALEGFAHDQLDTEWKIKGVPKWDGVLNKDAPGEYHEGVFKASDLRKVEPGER